MKIQKENRTTATAILLQEVVNTISGDQNKVKVPKLILKKLIMKT